ncbi:50S ribosomal protein L25 [Candidatus Microgenomates bacterium]|nr:50S ribosomal protein L25 [Candidatus Microgenomates bacterium]
MDTIKLTAKKREATGRQVKKLRRDGILPANVYGKGITSMAVELPVKEFNAVYQKTGETGLIELAVDKTTHPVLITNVQVHPVTDLPLHADFRQVDLKEKITAPVPVELIGESPAEKSGVGILVQQLNEVEVEALPTDLPEKIEVDISGLENVEDSILVNALSVDRSKVEIKAEPEQIVVKIEPPAAEEVAPEPVAAEGGEGVETPEGEAPTAEGEATPEGGEIPAAEGEAKKDEE